MKICIKCNEIKTLEGFSTYKNRKGERLYYNQCRVCKAEYKNKHYQQNKEPYLERSRKQKEADPEGYKQYLRNYYRENKDQLREKSRVYSRENSEARNARYRAYSATEEGATKNKARKKVRTALRNGSLVRPSVCEDCKQEKFTEAHHEDYSKPLDVQWLCKECHWKRHSTHHLNEGN